jgi:hypothetical protein
MTTDYGIVATDDMRAKLKISNQVNASFLEQAELNAI